MMQFLNECVAPVNLPLTVVMGGLLLYWLMIILGVVGMDLLDFDFDADVDLDPGVDAGIDVDGSFLDSALKYMHVSDMPVMIIISIFVCSLWWTSVFVNHYLNPDLSWLWWCVWFLPCLLFSLVLTKVIVAPFAKMSRERYDVQDDIDRLIDQTAVVTTSEVTDKFGQVEIRQDGPAVTLNVRTTDGSRLRQGDAAKLVAHNPESDTYVVELTKWEKD